MIKLDVVVTNRLGNPATGLESKDFALFDNGQPNRILTFQADRSDSPVEIILVIDTLRMPGILASHQREEVEKFLQWNDGHQAQPVSIFRLRDSGLWLVADPSKDGNALAQQVARDDQGRSIRKALGPRGLFGSGPEELPGLLALKSLADILTAERQKPGRKLLVWIGPRREENGSPFDQERLFKMIAWFSTLLRESRVALYSYSEGEGQRDVPTAHYAARYKDFLNGAKSVKDAEFGYLDRRVLAVQSGGRVLDSTSELADLIKRCVEEANAFYTLSFNPLPTSIQNTYHDLKIQVGTPELTARSTTGYYDQPFYRDQPSPTAKRVTVDQLEQILQRANGKSDRDVSEQISHLELTERLSEAKLSSWTTAFRSSRARQVLVALADASAFLAPPAAEIPADPPPDASAQRNMISLANDYLNDALQKLPNLIAMRSTVRYEETPAHDQNGFKIDPQPLHSVSISKATVVYRRGQEVIDAVGAKNAEGRTSDPYLTTYGTFGPILSAATDAVVASTDFAWGRWERDPAGLRAVFRYRVAQSKSHFRVGYCCLPDGDGTTSFQTEPEYHGEITIDPATGTVLRLTMEADLDEDLPIVRSEILVSYGTVDIGGKTYICPVRSIAIWRSRTVSLLALTDWGQSFRSYGPFATMLSDMTFDDYHIFRAESHVLTDVPDKE